MSIARRVRARLSQERGYTLIEMLTVMMILGTVLTGLTTLFVSASHAQVDMNERYQAQQAARLALERIRRDIHCAGGAVTTGTTLTVTLGTYCKTGVGNFTWCTVALGTNRYGLYRKAGDTCDAGGLKLADHLTQASVFTVTPQSPEVLARVGVVFPVDIEAGGGRAYRLEDAIVLRNSSRT